MALLRSLRAKEGALCNIVWEHRREEPGWLVLLLAWAGSPHPTHWTCNLGCLLPGRETKRDILCIFELWLVFRPGLYTLRNWQFRAVKLDTCDMTYDRWGPDDNFVPLEITFEVRQI